MGFSTLVKRWVRLHKGEFSPVICQDDSFIMCVHTLDGIHMICKTRVKFHRGRGFLCYLTRCFHSACSYVGRSKVELVFL